MDTDSEMFLLAAEELNFTRAAKRAYVTQQCLSAHIKKLEIRMGAPLFERVPYMALTPAGKVLYRSLRRIELIERSCRENIEAIREGTQGEVTLGMNAGRVQFFLPRLYEAYHRKFPHVTLKVVIDDVKNQARRLLDGKIDFLVGVNCPVDRDLVFTPLKEEKVFFLATDSYLKAHAKSPGAYPKTLRTGIIDMKEYDTLSYRMRKQVPLSPLWSVMKKSGTSFRIRL